MVFLHSLNFNVNTRIVRGESAFTTVLNPSSFETYFLIQNDLPEISQTIDSQCFYSSSFIWRAVFFSQDGTRTRNYLIVLIPYDSLKLTC